MTCRRPCVLAPLRVVALLALAAWGVLCAPHASSAEPTWPQAQPLRWVVAYPAGGGSDFLARVLAPEFSRRLGQQVIVDNRPGAAGIIGTEVASKAAADGYTLLTGDNGAFVYHPVMYRKLPYAPNDFAPVGFMARFPLIVAANVDAPIADGKALVAALKDASKPLSYASPGVGSPHHLAFELLKQRLSATTLHVPYRGTALALQDVIGGAVPLIVVDTAAGLAHLRAGKLRALATFAPRRLANLPDVPTLGELGVKEIETSAWQALFVPRKTPPATIAVLERTLVESLQSMEVKRRLEDYGLEVAPSDATALRAFLNAEAAAWHPLIRARGLRAD